MQTNYHWGLASGAPLLRHTQDSLQMLWLAAYLTGVPPAVLHALRWTHGLTPMFSLPYTKGLSKINSEISIIFSIKIV